MSKCKVKLKLTLVDWKAEGFSSAEEWAEDYMINELNCELTTFSIHSNTPYTSALVSGGDIMINNNDLYKVEVVFQSWEAALSMRINEVEKSNGDVFISGEYDDTHIHCFDNYLEYVRQHIGFEQV